MATIASLVVDLTASTSRFERSMSRARKPVNQLRLSIEQVERTLDRFTRTSRRLTLWGGATFAALTKAGSKMVDLASQAEQLNNVISRSFGSLSAEVNQWAEETGNALGRSTHSMRTYAGYMQALIKPVVGVTDKAAEMSMTLAQLAIDLAAFYDTEDEDAFNALRSALMGQVQPMKRFGVAMTQSALQAFALERGIKKNINAMTEAEKVMLRYEYLIDRTRIAQGTALQEADEYANVQKAIREEFQELAESMGHILKPAFLHVIQQGRELIRSFQQLDDATKANVAQWALLGGALVGFVTVLGVVGMGVSALIKGLMLFGSVISFVTSPLVLGLTLVALAVAGLKSAWDNNWGGIRDKTLEVWGEIQPKITALHERFQEKWEWIVYLAGDAWAWLTETTWAEKWEDIKGWLTSGWDWLVNIAGSAWSWLTETTWTEKVEDVKGWLSKAWDWTMNLAGNAWAWIEENLPWLADALAAVKSLIAEGWEWVVDTAGSAWDWFSNSEVVNELIGRLDALKARITDSEAWKWTVDVGLPAVLETGEMVIKAVVELGGEIYDAIKTGFGTGDWGPLFGIASDLWSKGALIWLGFEVADTTFEIVKKKIVNGLGLSGATGGLVGTGLVIGVATIGIQLAEAWAKGDYENFMKNIVAASIAAVFGGTIGGPAGAIVTFDIVLNLKLGEKIEGWVESWYELLGIPRDHMKLLEEYEKYRESVYESANLSWWDKLLGRKPEGLLSFEEWKQAIGLDSLEVEVEPIPVGIDEFVSYLEDKLSQMKLPIDWRFLAAQWGLETGWGQSLPAPFNLAGIKGTGPAGSVTQLTREVINGEEVVVEAQFAAFNNIEEFINAYLKLLETSYPLALRARSIEDFVAGLLSGVGGRRYATDPKYADLVAGTYSSILKKGFAEGGYTGNRPVDEVVGVVHGQEIVIPAYAVRKGMTGILEFLGVPGFQSGRLLTVPGLDTAKSTVASMNTMFKQIGQTILSGLSTLFEIIANAIEALAIALVGEEKVAEIKGVFSSMRTALEDFRKALQQSSEPEMPDPGKAALKWWEKFTLAFDELDWTQPINSFVNTLSNGLVQAENLLAQFTGELTRLVRVIVEETDEGTFQITMDWNYMLAQMANGLANMIAESLVNLMGGYEKITQRKDPFPRLEELVENMENFDKNAQRLLQLEMGQDLATIGGGGLGAGIGFAVGGPLGALIGGFLGAIVGRKGSEAITRREILKLTEKLKTDFLAIKEMLGTTMQDVANALGRAFSADTYEDFLNGFSRNLEDVVRNALITGFLSREGMYDLIEQLSNQISWAVIDDGDLDANERTAILDLYQKIVDRSSSFYNALQELGIATGETADKMGQLNDSLRNVPQGLKIVSNRLAAAGYSVPGLHNLAYEEPNDRVTEPKMEIHIHGSIYGVDELKRVIKTTVAETQRRVSLATNGVG